MDPNKVNQFLAMNAKFFTTQQLMDLRNRFLAMPDHVDPFVYAANLKDPTTSLIVSLLLGGLGIDRFMIGDVGLGVGKLLTAGGCGIWALIDLFLIMDATRDKNYRDMLTMMGYY